MQQLAIGENSYAEWLQVRTTGDPAKMTSAVRAALAELDPNLPVLRIQTISDLTDRFVSNDALISRLSGIFSALAVLLAGIGLYGVMSYSVVRRTNEIGIRIRFGRAAWRRDVDGSARVAAAARRGAGARASTVGGRPAPVAVATLPIECIGSAYPGRLQS